MPELRIDPIMGRRVYVAEDRAGRPSDYVEGETAAPGQASSATCPFCAGHEADTPLATATVLDFQGRWQVRVVPNKFPAVTLDAPGGGAVGVHEVIIESPEHLTDVVELGVERLATVLTVYRDRLAHWAHDPRLMQGLVFKNSGCAAGASLEHIHSQVAALPYIPAAVQAELDGAWQFYAAEGRCVFCDLVERETAAGERLVVREQGFAAVCAFAPRQPLETWILPERHAARFDLLEAAELLGLARVLRDVLRRLEGVSPGAPYNLLLHTGPYAAGAAAESFHWHLEIVPRLTHDAGLEWGAGVYICPLSPEHAAQKLRQVFPVARSR